MAWKEFKREDRFQGSDRPFITITAAHFSFNATFTRQVNLTSYRYVTIYVDDENKKLGFQFHNDERENSFRLSQQSSGERGGKRTGMQATSRGIVAKYPWVKRVTELRMIDRRFEPQKEGDLWTLKIANR